jgi:hypothetical protein
VSDPFIHSVRRVAALAMGGMSVLTFLGGGAAMADAFVATYRKPGVEVPNFTALCAGTDTCAYGTETFQDWNGGNFESTFSTGPSDFTGTTYITGEYASTSPKWVKQAADQYGGSDGTQPYPELFGGSAGGDSYSVALSHSADIPGVNYFGLWITALDQYNDLSFYRDGQLLYSFGPNDLIRLLGNCNDPSQNAYCGNPTTNFSGQDNGELFAYVNFFDTTGYFDTVELSNSGPTGFESSNHAVAYLSPINVVGRKITSVAEPGALAVFGTGLIGFGLVRRRGAKLPG